MGRGDDAKCAANFGAGGKARHHRSPGLRRSRGRLDHLANQGNGAPIASGIARPHLPRSPAAHRPCPQDAAPMNDLPLIDPRPRAGAIPLPDRRRAASPGLQADPRRQGGALGSGDLRGATTATRSSSTNCAGASSAAASRWRGPRSTSAPSTRRSKGSRCAGCATGGSPRKSTSPMAATKATSTCAARYAARSNTEPRFADALTKTSRIFHCSGKSARAGRYRVPRPAAQPVPQSLAGGDLDHRPRWRIYRRAHRRSPRMPRQPLPQWSMRGRCARLAPICSAPIWGRRRAARCSPGGSGAARAKVSMR